MSRPRQPIDLIKAKGKKHLTKAEYEARKSQEIKVNYIDVTAPDYLPDNLKVEFDEIAKKLLTIGIITELDEDALARYLLAKQNYLAFTHLLNDAIKSGRIPDAERLTTLQDKAFKQCRASASDLGLTIASRCKLVLPKIDDEKPINKFDKFKK